MAGHFQNAQASCNKSDATFRKPRAKNSHGFPGCGVILMLVFVTCFCISAVFQSFFFFFLPSFTIYVRSIQCCIRNIHAAFH